ncbi:MAG: endonuclease/exonuclease/phosphatase family protein [Planctomycetota bacterium]|jgi:endonuclease/exonuclease/phosphatase family metal-dependent hydrolase
MPRINHVLAPLAVLAALNSAHAQPIALDGSFDDWPEGVRAMANAHHIFVRLQFEEVTSLQSSQDAIHLRFDLDSDATTGNPSASLGVDLEIVVSPAYGNIRDDNFTSAKILVHEDGSTHTFGIPDADLLWSPTHASDTFEMRFERTNALGEHIGAASTATLQTSAHNEDGTVAWSHDPITFDLPDAAPMFPTNADLPSRPEDSIRILSWNVRWGATNTYPEKFDRVFQALNPDVILIQEWDNRDTPPDTRAAIAEWFAESLPDVPRWHVERGNAAGVVVVSRYPLERYSDFDVQPITDGLSLARDDRTTRFIGARARTPIGDILLGSCHLKCCGAYNAYEDHQRRAEARGINALIKEAITNHSPAGVFIAGDFNLVGGAEPMLDLIDSLDLDGSHMTVADTPALGDRVYATWGGYDTRFPRGRLDYAVYSDSTLKLVNAFVLDVLALSTETLDAHGLQREDAEASDHLPLVFDVRLRESSPE